MTFTIICLDGFRYDYIQKTEFLKSLTKKSIYGEVDHGFGFASEFSAITGKTNEQLGIIASNFIYKPNEQGLKFFYFWNFLDSFPLKDKSRLILNLAYNTKEFLIGNNQPKSIFNIPLKYTRNFDYLFKKNFFMKETIISPTMFDLFRDKKVSAYMWPFIYKNNKTKIDLLNFSVNTTNTDERAFKKSVELLKENPDVCYIHFFSTDNLVHNYGINSEKTDDLIKQLDDFVETIEKYSDSLLIFSDHGMVDVKETWNLWKLVEETDCKFGEDYVMFLDSTLARFWFFNEKTKNKILNILSESKKGRVVKFKNKNIHKNFGEIIFQLNPGILLLPNFYQFKADRATHGYSGKCKDEKAFYILYKKGKKIRPVKKNIKIEEIFNIIKENNK